jgi:transposase-like protein
MASQQEELIKLQRRIAELEEENDILKKASAYFAKNQKK